MPTTQRAGRFIAHDEFKGKEPVLLCSPCYDKVRSTMPGLSRLVHRPKHKLVCKNCGKTYSTGSAKEGERAERS